MSVIGGTVAGVDVDGGRLEAVDGDEHPERVLASPPDLGRQHVEVVAGGRVLLPLRLDQKVLAGEGPAPVDLLAGDPERGTRIEVERLEHIVQEACLARTRPRACAAIVDSLQVAGLELG